MADRIDAPEVVKEVKAEIEKMGKGLGDINKTIKENNDAINRNLEEFKAEVKANQDKTKGEFNTIVDDKLVKLSEDITTRQEIIDNLVAAQKEAENALNKRMDDVEVAAKRTFKTSDMTQDEAAKEVKDAKTFRFNNLTVKAGDKGITPEEEASLPEVNVEEYMA